MGKNQLSTSNPMKLLPKLAALSLLTLLSPLFLPPVSAADIQVRQLSLVGTLTESGVEFTATGTIEVDNKRGADISLLAGNVALLEPPTLKSGKIEYKEGEYRAIYTRSGEYPFTLRFLAKVHETDDQKSVAFNFLSTPIRRLELKRFPADAKLRVENAATPVLQGDTWIAPLSPNSLIKFSWSPAVPDDEGQLFYTANIANVTDVAPGMIKQNQKAKLQILQGELSEIAFALNGPGEISQVEGRDILGWKVDTLDTSSRRLLVRFNRPQSGSIALLIRSQTALPKLPTSTSPLLIEPLAATRSSGNLLLLSDGAVNLGIASWQNLSQISPEQVPLDTGEKQALRISDRQAFGFRYAGIGQELQIQIDDILPEISVSAIYLHHLGLNETSIDLDLNIEIRDASLQELSLVLPSDFSILSIQQPQLNDYTTSARDSSSQNLRLLFSRPLIGRQTLKLSLERNGELSAGSLPLPRIDVPEAKTVRGYLGVTSDSGLKVTRATDSGLTEIIPSYFPVKNDQLQVAYRLRETDWSASVQVERLEPTIQAEAFHLFSLAESVVYGSTILTYQISGAPVQNLALQLPDSYQNVELSGANIQDWSKEDESYLVNFHSPISGSYSLLATYESKHSENAPALSFSGATPLDTHSERGYIVFVSPNQVEIDLGQLQSPLLALEPKELPPEYQIMVDSPIIASLHYASRPFTLDTNILALPREKSIDQVVELADIETSITKTGEILFEANYVFKSKNVANFSLQLPETARLWKIAVDGTEPVVSRDGDQILIPISNESKSLTRRLSIRYTLQQDVAQAFTLTTPQLAAPILKTHWILQADEGYQLYFIEGTIAPFARPNNPSPLQSFAHPTSSHPRSAAFQPLLIVSVFALPILFFLRRSQFMNRLRWLPYLACLAASFGLLLTIPFASSFQQAAPTKETRSLSIQDTVLSAGESLSLTLNNIEAKAPPSSASPIPGILLAIALPFAFRWASGRFATPSARLPALLGANLLTAGIFAFLPNGAALLVALLASLYFSPILQISIDFIVSNFRSRSENNKLATAGAATALLFLLSIAPPSADAQERVLTQGDGSQFVRSEAVDLKAFVTDEFATVTLNFTWDAATGDSTPLLFVPAVITRLEIPSKYVSLGQRPEGRGSVYTLNASRAGKYEIEVEYQTPVQNRNGVWNFSIQSLPSLVYQSEITFDREDCEVLCDSAVGIRYLSANDDAQTKAALRFKPNWNISITSKPRDRDTRLEETVFYAETVNSYHPQAGAIAGYHHSTLRIAQGELRSVSLAIPPSATVTDVAAAWVETWRYDPSSHTLAISANRPLKGTVEFIFQTQTNARALPYSAKLELVRFPLADSELGWLGLSVSPEEQFASITASNALASASVYDFPAIAAPQALDSKLRRAYRYADPSASITFELAKVDPEIRVESEELTSLSEDRIVHNATLKTQILRSGVFQIQLQIPPAYDIEKISGPEISHWTDSTNAEGKRITLHFKNRTEGSTTQYLTLSAPGIRQSENWSPPHIKVVNASKQRGSLTLSPELGLQFKLLQRAGVSQLDPYEVSVIDHNRIGFRLLETDWKLALQIEPVDPWIDCQLLQDLTFKSGIIETKAALHYEIKNAGVKQLRLRLPASAVGVRFIGEHISGFQQAQNDPTIWEVDLDRRLINNYVLQVEYQEFDDNANKAHTVSGITTLDTQLQECFLSLRTEQRLSLQLEQIPASLAQIEWQQVPDTLRSAKSPTSASAVYRTIQPDYALALSVQRLDMAQVLPAEIRRVTLDSTLSESGMILTRATFSLDSGHKPNLSFLLPPGSQFWSCNVAGQSVWPVEKEGKLLVPLESSSSGGALIDVELNYLLPAPKSQAAFAFIGPQCDLPLENIQWRLFIPASFQELEWDGSLDLVENARNYSDSFDLAALIGRNEKLESQKLKNAENLLKLGNTLAKEGKQIDAKRAFESAYNLSLNDLDFNEDARVQWNNLRIQQAMVGLTTRRNNAFNKTAPQDLNLHQVQGDQINFSNEWASQLLQDNNSAEVNRALSDLALRFVEHQDSALRNPSGLTLLLPEHGRRYTFQRKLQAEPWQAMTINLQTSDTKSHATLPLLLALAATLALTLIYPTKRK
ncbi:hypothetical protein VDG1235_1773 [Verrucomicrobiia bacterium DG1235]|nr:hypothetical protein VDG1235_1773 [Verrucomicrobiae bacterium DG1235]